MRREPAPAAVGAAGPGTGPQGAGRRIRREAGAGGWRSARSGSGCRPGIRLGVIVRHGVARDESHPGWLWQPPHGHAPAAAVPVPRR